MEARAKRYTSIGREAAKPGVVNVNPIQRGGLLTAEARKALQEFGDGYSILPVESTTLVYLAFPVTKFDA